MHVVENAIEIHRSPEEVFDYAADLRTEADWNPVATDIGLIGSEPVGRGSRFAGSWKGLGRSTLEIVEFERPSTWTTRTVQATLPFRLVGTVEPVGAGSARLTMRIELMPQGWLTMLTPLLTRAMQRTAKANMVRIKETVEGQPAESGSPGPAA